MKRKAITRLIAAALCIALGLGLVFTLGGGRAYAYTSLPHIEDIVSSMKAGQEKFVVLELVPEARTGSIGYYIEGGEPCGDWAEVAASLGGDGGSTGPQARAAYVNALFTNLRARGLMSSNGSTPLTLGSNYQETFPWNTVFTDDTMELQLVNADGTDRHETAYGVPGVFTSTTGDYNAHYEYSLMSSGGSHIQAVSDLISAVQPVMRNGQPLLAMVGTDEADPETYGKYVYFVTYIDPATMTPLLDPDTNQPVLDGEGAPVMDPDSGTLVSKLMPAERDDQLILAEYDGASEAYMCDKRDSLGLIVYQDVNGVVVPRDDRGELILTDENGVTIHEGLQPVRSSAAQADYSYVYEANAAFPADFSGFYYRPDFAPFNDAAAGTFPAEWPEDTPLFTRTAEGVYEFFAVTTDELVLDLNVQYYVLAQKANGVPSAGVPSTSLPDLSGYLRCKAALGCYGVSNADGYRDVGSGSGYFSSTLTHYEFVGKGNGDHSFAYSSSAAATFNIQYDVVYCTGGFTNNDWFLKYVFDRSDADLGGMDFIVNSVTPAELEAQPGMAAMADLIVLSAGYSLADGSGRASAYSAANDVGSAVSAAISAAEEGGTPVIVESALLSCAAPNLSALAQSLKSSAAEVFAAQLNKDYDGAANAAWAETAADADGSFVAGGVLLWDRSAPYWPLASASLASELTGSARSGYLPVLKEIEYENWLRQRQGQTGDEQLLPREINLANTIRYIINSSDARSVTPKTSIRVLELEPSTSSPQLTARTVSDWLGGSVAESKITIDAMSAYEFIGKLEDLNEAYDLIYVGDSAVGLNSEGDSTVFNDGSMDGLVYFNIGDEFRATYSLSGLLSRDYSGGYLSYGGDSNLFRFSGNDLTAERQTDLTDFADAGYPVILADSLVIPGSGDVAVTASLKGSTRGDASALLSVELKSGDARYLPAITACQWYRDGELILSGASSSIEVNAEAGASHDYHCLVSVKDGSGDVSTNTVTVARSGEVKITESGQRQQGGYNYGATTYSVRFWATNYPKNGYHNNNTAKFSVSVTTGNSSVDVDSWRWEYSEDNRRWSTLDGGSKSSLSLNVSYNNIGYYRYVAVENGVELASNPISLYYGRNNRYYLSGSDVLKTTSVPLDPVTFDLDVSTQTDSGSGYFILTASVPGFSSSDFDFVWYRSDYSRAYEDGDILERRADSSETSYYCYASYNGDSRNNVRARSYTYTVSYGAMSVSASGEPGQGLFSTTEQINNSKVDSSSHMYAGLSQMLGAANVTTVSALAEERGQLLKYLNLSKPRIVWTEEGSFPVEYDFNGGAMTSLPQSGDGHYYLSYGFSIENLTDATPGTTTYDALLCIDLNSDGKYTTESEEITDVVIRGADGALISPDGAGVYYLKADTEYILTRQMPNGYAGIIPWQLSIVKNDGARQIRASQQGYTRIEPSAELVESINILQINSKTYNDASLDLEDQLYYTESYAYGYYRATKNTTNGPETRYYKGLFGKLLFEVEDFDISITTITTDDISGSAFYNKEGERRSINDYDMLIIGFADMYGNFDQETADAVVAYAASGKAILFTHDTTSATNYRYYYNNDYSYTRTFSPWGYYFNTVLRDTVGLDRYGITTNNVFRSALWSGVNNADNADAVTAAGYSMAYEPGSARAATVPEAQGYSNYLLMTQNATRIGGSRQYLNSDSGANYGGGLRTDKVTQVNKGQITTYPYDVNTTDFGGSISSSMTVAKTHEQYYQVNMNSDDIVVWYCLANNSATGGDYFLENDVTNAYYIYSKGSITYSGMGHFAGGDNADSYYTQGNNAYSNEAKLFVNTMIAAYRTVTESPTVLFTADASGETGIDYFFLTSEYSDDGAADGLLELDASLLTGTDATKVYFKISDPNLNTGKSISLQMYYTLDASVTDEEVARPEADSRGQRSFASLTADGVLRPTSAAWYSADGNAPGAELKGGLVYYVYLPADVLTALSGTDVLSVKLFVRITATIDGAAVEGSGVDSVELRKIGLFKLS